MAAHLPAHRSASRTLAALSLLYAAQGVPFGFASEYLPVALRQSHYSMAQIAAVGFLQAPWYAKMFWSTLADRPAVRARSRDVLFVLQMLLFGSLALFAASPLAEAPRFWFALTFLTALVASTQDIFVDALAVRSLPPEQRGFGNTAQVAGYRLGMLAGGAGLLLLIAPLGYRRAVLACAMLVLVATPAARLLREGGGDDAPPSSSSRGRLPVLAMFRHLFAPGVWPVIVLALTYKAGLHMAGVLIKPIVVDAKWTDHEIGVAVVTVGIAAGLTGAAFGGLLHRSVRERSALLFAGVLQAVVCVPLLVAVRLGVPHGWTTAAIATESFVSGLGTTVLFAALMSATRKADAGLHYTLLTSANNVAIGFGGIGGGWLADHVGKVPVLGLAAVVSALPLALLIPWDRAVRASAGVTREVIRGE